MPSLHAQARRREGHGTRRRLGYPVRAMPLLVACCLAIGLSSPPLATGLVTPEITHLEANVGPQRGGTTVAIEGVGLSGAQTVRFGPVRARRFRVVSDSLIEAVSPAGRGEVEVRVTGATGEASLPEAVADFAYEQPPSEPWLGLNGNSVTYLGPIDAFVEHHVVYDRSGGVEWSAGETLRQGGAGLARSIRAGMIPIVTIEFAGYSSCSWNSECLPSGNAAIGAYVRGFVQSATEMLDKYPAAEILFEAINEPWGYGSAAQYAAILARLLPAAERAGIPVARIYVAATGEGWVGSMYSAQPALRREIGGWYMHPYNRTRTPGSGVAAMPPVQAEMTSGQANVIASELGFCAPDVNRAGRQCEGSPAPATDAAEAAAELTDELRSALAYHRAGWLRALVVYSRNDGGWAMQLPHGRLTLSGRALDTFAQAYG